MWPNKSFVYGAHLSSSTTKDFNALTFLHSLLGRTSIVSSSATFFPLVNSSDICESKKLNSKPYKMIFLTNFPAYHEHTSTTSVSFELSTKKDRSAYFRVLCYSIISYLNLSIRVCKIPPENRNKFKICICARQKWTEKSAQKKRNWHQVTGHSWRW